MATATTLDGLILDGGFHYLDSLPKEQRVPRFRANGLPPRGTSLTEKQRAAFERIGAPGTVMSAGR